MHAGGMAHVYKVLYAPAADGSRRSSEFPMAMKIPRMTAGDGAENIISFEVELQILSELKGHHVPRFVAAGDLVNLPYLVMEHVQGQTLQQVLDAHTHNRTRADVTDIARYGASIARAAHSLHQQNTCHLDIKPANVLMHPNGHAVLLDFGLSCHAHYPDLLAEELRKAVGSPAWIAPEQVVGVRGDPRSDIFAIGVMLYELATGELPFGNPQTNGGMRQRLWMDPQPPRQRRAEVPEWLQEIILRCLEPRAADRYQSATRLRQVLRDHESVILTERADRVDPLSFWENLKRMFRAAGYEPSPSPRPSIGNDDAPLMIAAIDTRQSDEDLRVRMQTTAKNLLQAYPESRLVCISTIASTPTFEGNQESETASGIVRGHLVQLMEWAKPLKLPPERISYHVLEALDPASRIVEFAKDNDASLILIGASHKPPNKVTPWRTSMTKIAEEAPCSVHIVRT